MTSAVRYKELLDCGAREKDKPSSQTKVAPKVISYSEGARGDDLRSNALSF